MKKLIFAIMSGAALTGGMAIAQQQQQPAQTQRTHHPFFERLDTNKDGAVTRDEVKASAEKRFDAIDADKNGVITRAERDALRAKRMDDRFAAMDADKSGQLNREEFRAAHDRKSDGKRHAGRHHRHHGKWDMMKGKDGDISKADFTARPMAMFDRLDTDKDGRITAAERDAARAKMKEMRKMHHKAPGTAAPAKPQS